MWFAARLAAVYVAAFGSPLGGGHEYGIEVCGQSLICWLQEDVDRRLRHFHISAQLVTN